MTKGVIYYSHLTKDPVITKMCQEQIKKSCGDAKIVSVTPTPCDFGINVIHPIGEKYIDMFERILIGAKALDTDVVYLVEDDVLYDESHFKFDPPAKDKYYYNGNYWFLRMEDGFAIHYNVSPLSGLVADRNAIITHFEERLAYCKEHGFSRQVGFEPFTHHRIPWKTWYDFEIYMSEKPNIDIALSNSTWKRWKISQFRRKPTFWVEGNHKTIPGWPQLPSMLSAYLPDDNTLTIVIPARNEEFLGLTVENLLKNIEGNTEIVVVLDGYEVPIPAIPQDKRVIILGYHSSIGQRAATNQAVRLSKSKYIMKVDAHCVFDKGFDVKMMARMQDDITMVPIMYNLHAFNWVCKNGHSRYQSPSGPCKVCGEPTKKEIVWKEKRNPESVAYTFDKSLHFQYFGGYKERPEYKAQLENDNLTETMSLQGSCFMCTREKYWELELCDEKHGSWGQQGVEVACKTWLSGGRVLCNHDTWYAHMFRTQGGDFGFPYKLSGSDVDKARKYSKQLFLEGNFPKAIHDLQWLIDKFKPVKYWEE